MEHSLIVPINLSLDWCQQMCCKHLAFHKKYCDSKTVEKSNFSANQPFVVHWSLPSARLWLSYFYRTIYIFRNFWRSWSGSGMPYYPQSGFRYFILELLSASNLQLTSIPPEKHRKHPMWAWLLEKSNHTEGRKYTFVLSSLL